VAFLVSNPKHSLCRKVGANLNDVEANETVLGIDRYWFGGRGVAEVYWDRAVSLFEVVSSIFHEAAHLREH
jgi:hypothetical protein